MLISDTFDHLAKAVFLRLLIGDRDILATILTRLSETVALNRRTARYACRHYPYGPELEYVTCALDCADQSPGEALEQVTLGAQSLLMTMIAEAGPGELVEDVVFDVKFESDPYSNSLKAKIRVSVETEAATKGLNNYRWCANTDSVEKF